MHVNTCLIAAHDPWYIQLLKVYAEEFGLLVTQAFDGAEVIKKVLNEKPTAVFLQMDMPGSVKSADALKALRADPSTNQVPVFVFSWRDDGDDAVEGASVQLNEPITYEMFADALESAGVSSADTRGSEPKMRIPGRKGSPR